MRRFFSADSIWTRPLPADAPLHPEQDAFSAELIRQRTAANQAGGFSIARNHYSTPVYEVAPTLKRVPVTLLNGTVPYPQALDGNPAHELAYRLNQGVPIPANAVPAAGTDQHLTIVNQSTGELWELWKAVKTETGWTAKWGGYLTDHRRSAGRFRDERTSIRLFAKWGATASSLPLVGGLILKEELDAGLIEHALHCVLPVPGPQWTWPAQRGDSWPDGIIGEGTRFRLRADFDVTTLVGKTDRATQTLRAVATALQSYGAIVTDRNSIGNPISFRCEADLSRSDTDALGDPTWRVLSKLPAAEVEFIDPAYRP